MNSRVITDEPCGRHPFVTTPSVARAAVPRQREQDAGMENLRSLVAQSLRSIEKQRRLADQMQEVLESAKPKGT